MHTLQGRRRFVRQSLLGTAGLTLAPGFPAVLSPSASQKIVRPVTITGRVQARGKGIARVAVSDGATVVTTGRDGGYQLFSTSDRSFVFISLPSGYQIPTNPTGTARFYVPLRADAKASQQADFSLEPLQTSDEKHHFLVLADPQIQNQQEAQYLLTQTVPDVQGLLKSLPDQPTFGVGCGDLIFDDLPLFTEYEKAVSSINIPFFQVIGNHDLDLKVRSDEQSDATFRKHFGPTYYSFNRGKAHYVVLDDVFYHGAGFFPYLPYVHETQLQWLYQDLALVEPGSPVVVFLHIPMHSSRMQRYKGTQEPLEPWFTLSDFSNPQALYELLKPFKAHLISGHTHENEHAFVNGLHEHILGTVCGAWWSGPICFDGTPNGYGLYEVNGEDIRWQYKATGNPLDYQLALFKPGENPSGQWLANVWDWEPGWKVFWYENGIRKGEMQPLKGYDPRAQRLYGGKEMPAAKKWVEPILTNHLFTVPTASAIMVECIDRWGRKYSTGV